MSYVSVSPGLGAINPASRTLAPVAPVAPVAPAPRVTPPVRLPVTTRAPIVRAPLPSAAPAPTSPPPPPDVQLPVGPPSAPVGEPQPLASIFVKKLTELVAKGLLDEEVKDLQKLLPMTEEQLRALVATAESKGKKGAAEIRAAFEQSIIELAAFKADEAKRKNMLIAGGVAVAAVAAFFFMRRKKS